MKLRDVLKRKGAHVAAIDAAEPLSEAIARFSEGKARCLVVTDGGNLAGILTIRDALLHLHRAGADALSQAVREGMTKDVVSVTPETSLGEAHELFAKNGINHLPVVEGSRLAGLVTRVDLLTSETLSAEELNAHMREYIHGSHF